MQGAADRIGTPNGVSDRATLDAATAVLDAVRKAASRIHGGAWHDHGTSRATLHGGIKRANRSTPRFPRGFPRGSRARHAAAGQHGPECFTRGATRRGSRHWSTRLARGGSQYAMNSAEGYDTGNRVASAWEGGLKKLCGGEALGLSAFLQLHSGAMCNHSYSGACRQQLEQEHEHEHEKWERVHVQAQGSAPKKELLACRRSRTCCRAR